MQAQAMHGCQADTKVIATMMVGGGSGRRGGGGGGGILLLGRILRPLLLMLLCCLLLSSLPAARADARRKRHVSPRGGAASSKHQQAHPEAIQQQHHHIPAARQQSQSQAKSQTQNGQQAQTCNQPQAQQPQPAAQSQQQQQLVNAAAAAALEDAGFKRPDQPAASRNRRGGRGGGAAASAASAGGGDSSGGGGGNGGAHLTVSVQGLQDVPSTQHTYGTIELTNSHPSSALRITSMDASPMLLVSDRRSASNAKGGGVSASANGKATYGGSSFGLEGTNAVDVGSTVHQLQIADFGDRTLTLGPGKSASFPVVVHPAIPSDYLEHELYGGRMSVPMPASEAVKARGAALIAAAQAPHPAVRPTESPSADPAAVREASRARDEELASSIEGWIEHREKMLDMAEEYEWRRDLDDDDESLWHMGGGSSPTLHADVWEVRRGVDYSGQHPVGPMVGAASASMSFESHSDGSSAIPPSILQQTGQDPSEWKQYVRSDRNFHAKVGPSLLTDSRLHVVLAHLHIQIEAIPQPLVMPIWSSAARANPYGLPSTVTFRPDPSRATPEGDEPNVGTYQLCIYNPHADKDLMVYDVYVSDPDAGVGVAPLDLGPNGKDGSSMNVPGNYESIQKIDLSRLGAEPVLGIGHGSTGGPFIAQKARTSDGPVALRPYEAATIGMITFENPFEFGRESEIDGLPDFLGYVHIRTSEGSMAVALESAPAVFNSSAQAMDHRANAMVAHGSGTAESEVDGPPKFDQDVLKSGIDKGANDDSLSQVHLLSSSPAAVQFGLLSSPLEESQFSTIFLNITNHATESLRIMRVTIGIDDDSGGDLGVPNSLTTGISMEVVINGTSSGVSIGANTHSLGDLVIPAGATLDGAIAVMCRPTSKFASSNSGSDDQTLPQQFSGSIIIHSALASMESHEEWRQAVARGLESTENDSSDHDVFEIPFKVDVFHGSLRYDASQTYFPVGMAATASSEYDGPAPKQNSQRLVIGNGFPFPLFLLSADITGVGESSSNRCQAKFELVDYAKFVNYSGIHDDNGVFGFGIRHNELEADNASMKDERCGLSIQVLFGSYPPVEFVVPLNTYTGRLVAGLDHSYEGSSDVRFLSCQGRRQDDNECFVGWYQNTTLGQALKSHVGDMEVNTRQQKRKKGKDNNLQSLFEYLSNPQDADLVPSEVDPLVLDLGTLPLSSRRSYSLLLTNPNPVPMEVSPDHGGSVEGMSIGLGKTRIDSLTLLKRGAGYRSDDPRSLLSEATGRFLSTSGPSRAFFGRLADSDDVSPATQEDCDLITPSLSDLFYKHATVTVRASPPSSQKVDDVPGGNPPLLSCFSGGNIPGLDNTDCQSSSWFSSRKECDDQSAAGILLSDNGIKCFVKPTASNSTAASASVKKDIWYLPPASTARLDLTIITPPWSVLRRLSKSEGGSMDMLPLLSTGLVVRSSLGQAIPIIVTYQALLAELNAGADGSFLSMGLYRGEEEKQIIDDGHGPTGRLYHSRVDPAIVQPRHGEFSQNIGTSTSSDRAKRRRTPLQIRSTLGDSFDIVKLSSCNPWFDFELKDGMSKMNPKDSDSSFSSAYSVYDADAMSTIRCEQSSFLSCALLFLESRSSVQPAGCGLSEAEAAAEYAYSPEFTWANHRYIHMLESLTKSAMAEGEGAFDMERAKWNGDRIVDLAHTRSHNIKVRDASVIHTHVEGNVHNDELSYAWQWLGVPFNFDMVADEEESNEGVKSAAIGALREASKQLDAMYSESVAKLRVERGEQPEKAFIHTLDLKPFLDARKAWRKVKEHKLHLMTGDLRAAIEHKPVNKDEKALVPFTADVPLAVLWTCLDPPSIFDTRPQDTPNATYRVDWEGTGIIDFSLTALSEVKTLYVPVHNPSGIPLRVRLTTIQPISPNDTASVFSAKWSGVDHRCAWSEKDLLLFDEDISPLHVHSCTSEKCSTEADRWWNGGAYYQITDDGTSLMSRQNVTVKAGSKSNFVLVNPSLHATTALVHGCGRRRCGLRDDQQQQAQANQNEATANFLNSPDRLYSTMGASAARREHLRGRIYDPVSGEETQESKAHKAEKCLDWSSPSCPALHDVVPPFAVSIDSLQKEIVLAPNEKAWLGPIYFRPSAASRFGSTLLIENSLTGIEPIKLTGVGATRQIAFEEGGVEGSAEVGKMAPLEIRYGMPALMFPGNAAAIEVVKGVQIRNAGSLPIEFRSASLAPFSLSQVTQRPVSSSTKNGARRCSLGSFTLVGCVGDQYGARFKLEPGEVKTLSFSHSPQCSLRKSFVVVNLEYSSKETGRSALPDEGGSQFLVGFDLSDEEMASCVPSHPSFADKLRGLEKLFRQEFSSLNPLNWSDVIEREGSNVWRQTLLLVWPILLLLIWVTNSVSVDRKVRRRFLSSTQIDINDMVSGIVYNHSVSSLLGVSHGTGDSDSNRALCQLAQSDPNVIDLAQAGRDQTRRLLLGRYRRVQAAMPRCLRPSGAFVSRGGAHPGAAATTSSEKEGSTSAIPQGPRPARFQGSLVEEVFGHSASSFNSIDGDAALPMALSWRGAAARGILPHRSRVSSGIGNRVGDLLKKRTELRKGSNYTDAVVAEAVAIVDDESKNGDSVPTTVTAPPRAATNGAQSNSSKKVTARKTEEGEKEDDIAVLLPLMQKTTSTQKVSPHYSFPIPTTATESTKDTKMSEGDWHIQSGGTNKTPRGAVPKQQVDILAKIGGKKIHKEEEARASPTAPAEIPSAASTPNSSATDESKRPEVTKKSSRRNVKSDSPVGEKESTKKSHNVAVKSESSGKVSKTSVAKQESPVISASKEIKTKKNSDKAKSSTKSAKVVEKAEKKGTKAEKKKEIEKKGMDAKMVEEKNGAEDDSLAGKANRQTKKKQKQKQQQQQQQQQQQKQQQQQQQQQKQQPNPDNAAATPTVADTSGSAQKKKKKEAGADKKRNSLGPSSPLVAPSQQPKKLHSMGREDGTNEAPLTPSAHSQFAKSVPNIRSNLSTPEAAPIAPPPGLVPPPGFLAAKEKSPGLPSIPDDASLSSPSHIPLDGGAGAPSGLEGLGGTELWLGNSSVPLGLDNQERLSGLRSDEPFATASGSNAPDFGGTLPLLDPASPGILGGRSLLGGGGGFNVQGFLDNILDESEMVEDDYNEEGERESDVGGSPLALGSGPSANGGFADAIATAAAIGGQTSDLLAPQQRFAGIGMGHDPWAAPDMPSSSALPTVPLLTPEQILGDNDTAYASTDERNKKEDGSHLMALFGANGGEKK